MARWLLTQIEDVAPRHAYQEQLVAVGGRPRLEAAAEWFAPFISVCAFAGLRLGEAAGLQLGDVDFLRRTISVSRQIQGNTKASAEVVPPKHGSERVVYVAAELIQVLAIYVEKIGVFGDEQWPFGAGGAYFDRNSA